MIAYGTGILPLIRELRTAHPHVMQLWFTENEGAVGMVEALHDHMRNLLVRGPPRGYFLDPTKSILVVSPRNVQRAEDHFRGMGVQVVTGIRYLGRFIGDQES